MTSAMSLRITAQNVSLPLDVPPSFETPLALVFKDNVLDFGLVLKNALACILCLLHLMIRNMSNVKMKTIEVILQQMALTALVCEGSNDDDHDKNRDDFDDDVHQIDNGDDVGDNDDDVVGDNDDDDDNNT